MAKQRQTMRVPALTDDGGRAEIMVQKPSILRRIKGLFRMDQQMWAEQVMIFNNNSYPLGGFGASASDDHEDVPNDFESYVSQAYKGSGAVFAGMEAWRLAFCEVRFQYQRMVQGRPGKLFGVPALDLLENPWDNAFTADLLARAINHVHLGGNHYVVTEGVGDDVRLRVLRPDWVSIILTAPPNKAVKSDIAGYLYKPGGTEDKALWKVYPIDGSQGTVAHWAPIPDPDAQYRGMSPLTPILTEIQSDRSIIKHKQKWFSHGASPSIAVSFKDIVTDEQFGKMMKAVKREHTGVDNAYKPMFLGGGADVKVLNAQPIDWLNVGGHGETRILAALNVHPTLVGLAENLHGSTLNQGNYEAAKNRFIDMGLRPQWRSLCQAYSVLVPKLKGARLWYDGRDIAMLRKDAADEAEYLQSIATTINSLVANGFTPDSAKLYVLERDPSLLEHTGLVSVQLLPPGTPAVGPLDANTPGKPGAGADKPDDGTGSGGNASSGTDQSGGTAGSSGNSGSAGTSGSGGK